MLKCNIKYRMVDNNIDDVAKLIELTGITRNTLNKLYKNKDIESMKLETLFLICDALNCNLSDLIEYTPEKNINAENQNVKK